MIDSGADHCVFPLNFLNILGIDPQTAPVEMTRGIGTSSAVSHFANVTVDLQGLIQFPVFAGFTAGLDSLALGVLGQVGFFDRFNLGFRLSEKTCLIEIPDRPV